MQTELEHLIDNLNSHSQEKSDTTQDIDAHTDIHATGLVLYRLLTGKRPPSNINLQELQGLIASANPTTNPEDSNKLADIVMKALEKNPQKGFQTANAFFLALKTLTESKTTDANNKNASPIPKSEGSQSIAADLGISTTFENILEDIDLDQTGWMMSIFEDWKKKELAKSNINETLTRLFDVPLYTDPFSGALLIDRYCLLLFWKGHILQAINFKTGTMMEDAFSPLPNTADQITLYTADTSERTETPLLLATLLSEDKPVLDRLDSEFTDIIGYVKKLLAGTFTGVIRFIFEKGDLYLFYWQSSIILLLQPPHLKMTPAETSADFVSRLIGLEKFTAEMYAANFDPLEESMRRFFQGASLKVTYHKGAESSHTALLDKKKADIHPQIVEELKKAVHIEPVLGDHREIQLGTTPLSLPGLLQQGFSYRFGQWFLSDFFITLISSGNRDTMKYVTTWIPSVTNIQLNTSLEDEDGKTHFFDMIMTDKDGKILHLITRGANGDIKKVTEFLEAVKLVKKKYIKGGDIGGASYVSDNDFTKEALNYYFEMTTEKKKKIGLASIDALTGYKGFVRMGKNRGFHFNLFAETSSGFNVIAPVL